MPPLLFSVPAPKVDDTFIKGKVLNLSFEGAEDLCKQYRENVKNFFISKTFDLNNEIIPAIEFGLRLFNAENFTGELTPKEREQYAEVLSRFDPNFSIYTTEQGAKESDIHHHTNPKDAFLQRLLTSDGEMVSPCLKLPGLLLCLVEIVSCDLGNEKPLVPHICIWRLRVHFRHQLVLKHRSHSVFVHIASCIDAILGKSAAGQENTVGELLEVVYAQSYYHRRELAEETISKAVKISGLQVKERCLAGVRTRWQQHQLPQLILEASGSRKIPEYSYEDQPVSVQGEKDGHDLLDRPREKPEAEPLDVVPLHPEDKALLLFLCENLQFHNPHHSLTTHRMMTYIERLLVDPLPSPFVVSCQILLSRARLEMKRNRVQERAFMQITELVDQYSARRDPNKLVFGRTESDFFYTVPFPSWWELKKEYGDFCFEENLFKTALSMYEEVQDWERIIDCCKQLDKRCRAESLARELLETDPENPSLWVALGEATRRDEHLWKAWELSHHKMAAPMRSLARLALDRERYVEVIQYFDEAVRINPIFGGDWFSLGYACLKENRWERSGEAFTRVCQMNPNDAYAWNNLGSIMMRSNKKRPAFNAISQALRQNRRDWRMWQNYFNVGCELQEVIETTNALNISLDIGKNKLVFDPITLELFVKNTIAYLKEEIPGTSSETRDCAEVREGDQVRYKSMKENDNYSDDIAKHIPVVSPDEGEIELTEIAPFGCASFFPEVSPSEQQAQSAERGRIKQFILIRHRHRVRALFLRITDVIVNDPNIYSCMALLIRHLDGPLSAYAYKIKELAVCHQKDLWEQDDILFQRTVTALKSTVTLLLEIYNIASETFRNPSCAVNVPDPSAQECPDYIERLEKAAFEPTPPSIVDGVQLISTGSPEYRNQFLLAVKETQNNIKRTIVAAEVHFENTPILKELQELCPILKKVLQEAKDEFDE